MLCPLCHSSLSTKLNHPGVPGDLFHCGVCDLISKESINDLTWENQKKRYDLHKNTIENQGYVQFFEQLVRHLRPYFGSLKKSLDWGSGPGDQPVLAELLRKEGLEVQIYDPIYQPEKPKENFDLITATEVIEHFQNPLESFDELFQTLKPGGILAGLTQFHQGPERISQWWYVTDPTHVVFYSEKTFHWIAGHWDLEILLLENPVFLFQRTKIKAL